MFHVLAMEILVSSSSIVLGSTLEIPPSIPIVEEAPEIVVWPESSKEETNV